AGARAAPEGVVLGVKGLPRAGRERQVILRVTLLRQDRADAVIDEGALIIIEITRVAGPAVEMPGELHHVVGAAAFGGRHAALQLRCQLPGLREPSFAVAGSAGDVGPRTR